MIQQTLDGILQSLGWTALHSLWQVTLIVIIWAGLRALIPQKAASVRYSLGICALIISLVLSVVTFLIVYSNINIAGPGKHALVDPIQINELVFAGQFTETVLREPSTLFLGGEVWTQIFYNFGTYTPVLGLIWCIGFVSLWLKYTGALLMTFRLRKMGVKSVPNRWQSHFDVMVKNAGIRCKVDIFVSKYIKSPIAFGWLKPVILVPVGFFTHLPPQEVEAILWHEIAHIRRHDFIVNLFQIFVKSVLFFHPAIHIMCRWIDHDRECACDDYSVGLTKDAHTLVRGLAKLQCNAIGGSIDAKHLAQAAAKPGKESGNMYMFKRLSRLCTEPVPRRTAPYAILSMLFASLGLTFGISLAGKIEAQPQIIEHMPDAMSSKITLTPTLRDSQRVQNVFLDRLQTWKLIEAEAQTAKITFPDGRMAVDGQVVPKNIEGQFCTLFDRYGFEKSEFTTINITPTFVKYTHKAEDQNFSFHVESDWAINTSNLPELTGVIDFDTFDITPFVASDDIPDIKMFKAQRAEISIPELKPVLVNQIRTLNVAGAVAPPQQPLAPAPAPKTPTISESRTLQWAGQSHEQLLAQVRNPALANFVWPVPSSKLSLPFGLQPSGKTHTGIDIAATQNAQIVSSADGVVMLAKDKGAWGNMVIIDHGNGVQSRYAHMAVIGVEKGQRVFAGLPIGKVGNTGRADRPHLHFEVRQNGVAQNPEHFLKPTHRPNRSTGTKI